MKRDYLSLNKHCFTKSVFEFSVFLFLSCGLFATDVKDVKTVYLPVVTTLDMERSVICDMWFECRAIEYNVPLSFLKAVPQSPAERLLSEIIDIVTQLDMTAAKQAAYWGQGDFSEQIQSQMQSLLGILGSLTENGLDEIEVAYQFFYDTTRVFYLKCIHPQLGPVSVPILMIELDSGIYWDFSEQDSSLRYLRAMVRDALDQSYKAAIPFAPPAERSFDHRISMTEAESAYPAYLLFNGKDFTDREYLSMEEAADQAVSLVWTRHSLVKTGNKDKIGALYTPRSRQIYDDIMERGVLAEYDWFIRIWQRPPQIEYVIDANPLYVPVRITSSGFAFEYVFRNTENDSERFQLTNFQGMDFLVRLLRSGHFASEFTRSLASKKQVQSQSDRD